MDEDVKNVEYLTEPLIEVHIDTAKSPLPTEQITLAATVDASNADENPLVAEDIKSEPLTIECTPNAEVLMTIENLNDNDIKDENQETEESKSVKLDKKEEETKEIEKEKATEEPAIPIELQEEERLVLKTTDF